MSVDIPFCRNYPWVYKVLKTHPSRKVVVIQCLTTGSNEQYTYSTDFLTHLSFQDAVERLKFSFEERMLELESSVPRPEGSPRKLSMRKLAELIAKREEIDQEITQVRESIAMLELRRRDVCLHPVL